MVTVNQFNWFCFELIVSGALELFIEDQMIIESVFHTAINLGLDPATYSVDYRWWYSIAVPSQRTNQGQKLDGNGRQSFHCLQWHY